MTQADSRISAGTLAIIPDRTYTFAMKDPTKLTVEDWAAAIEISEAQAAAGQSVPLEPILRRLRETVDKLEAKAKGTGRQCVGRGEN